MTVYSMSRGNSPSNHMQKMPNQLKSRMIECRDPESRERHCIGKTLATPKSGLVVRGERKLARVGIMWVQVVRIQRKSDRGELISRSSTSTVGNVCLSSSEEAETRTKREKKESKLGVRSVSCRMGVA
jgi:hypothetical protein